MGGAHGEMQVTDTERSEHRTREFILEVNKHQWAVHWMKNGGTFKFSDESFDYGLMAATSLTVRFVTWPEVGEYTETWIDFAPWNLFKASIQNWWKMSGFAVLRRLSSKIPVKICKRTHYARAVLPDIPLPPDMTKNMFSVWVNSK